MVDIRTLLQGDDRFLEEPLRAPEYTDADHMLRVIQGIHPETKRNSAAVREACRKLHIASFRLNELKVHIEENWEIQAVAADREFFINNITLVDKYFKEADDFIMKLSSTKFIYIDKDTLYNIRKFYSFNRDSAKICIAHGVTKLLYMTDIKDDLDIGVFIDHIATIFNDRLRSFKLSDAQKEEIVVSFLSRCGLSTPEVAKSKLKLTFDSQANIELYEKRVDKKEDPVVFINRVYGSYLNGEFTRADLRKIDAKAVAALNNYENARKTKVPLSQLNLPTVANRTTRKFVESELAPQITDIKTQKDLG